MANSAEAKTISTISEFFFEIPPYQRLYEWRKEQIETLLEDVKKACFDTQNKIYFIGNVVVSKKDDKYILIDGQQRLTTLFLIGIYLASKEKEVSESWSSFVKHDKQIRISMPLRENEEQWLSDFINKQNKSDNDFKDLSKKNPNIHYRITKGLETIAEWFEKNTPKEESDEKSKLASFAEYLYGNNEASVRFALVELAEGTDLNQFFVRMNNRGKQLEKHEILKARLLGILQKNDTSGEWKKYAKIWDLCSDMDKYIFQSASDRKFLNKEIDRQEGMKLNEILEKIEEVGNGNNGDNSKDNNDLEKVKSIIDFPTFLLHVAKLTSDSKDISINKDKLLENIVVLNNAQSIEKNNKKLFFRDDRGSVEKFIHNILKYRILFDYFVIKRVVDENLSKSGEYSIRHLSSSEEKNNTYYSIGGSVMEDLAMLQNYLRVAREGVKQNYHHWLTPFLKKLGDIKEVQVALKTMRLPIQDVCKKCKSPDTVSIDSINKIGKEQNTEIEKSLVDFLEKLDRDLAYAQMGRKSNNGDGGDGNMDESLLLIAKQYLEGRSGAEWSEEEWKEDFSNWTKKNLNQGTGTPHYWFYRLEYYLWKNREGRNDKLKINNKDFDFENIASNYRFRELNSVEHIWPQSKEGEKGWEKRWNDSNECCLDDFGNLALISQSFNSSLGDQSIGKKFEDIKERVRDNRVESLKMCLAYAKCGGNNNEWTPQTAKEHQDKMLDILKASLENKEQNRG